MRGLEFMQKTETGQHVDMEAVRLEKVHARHYRDSLQHLR